MSTPEQDHLDAILASVRSILASGPLLPALIEQSGRSCGRMASAARLDFGDAAVRCSDLFTDALDLNPLVGECLALAFVAGYDERGRGIDPAGPDVPLPGQPG